MAVWIFYNQQALVFLMDLQHFHIQDPSFLRFQYSHNQTIVSSHADNTFIAHLQSLTKISELCILTFKSLLFIQIYKEKVKYYSLPMHHFNIQVFQMQSTLNEFNQCANVHGHIHTQCTLHIDFQITTLPIRHFFHGVLELNQPITTWITLSTCSLLQ
jgi:hypothetical protein